MRSLRIALILMLLPLLSLNAQGSFTVTTSSSNYVCTKGAAGVKVSGLQSNDVLTISWSNGATNVFSIKDLDEGSYTAHVVITSDTVSKLDTSIVFNIEKEKCPVNIPNHFTPNDDDYNDTWKINNTNYYPNFELYVFNKWGQQVHSQKGDYTPWNGKWAGINVPDGTYYYVFYFDGGNKRDFLKGDVTILR